MIAVAKIGGHQEIVECGDLLRVDKLHAEVGETVEFEILLVSEPDGKGFKTGTPTIKGKTVKATIMAHGRGDKILIYKMKPRKRYRRTQGHRQDFTDIEITEVAGSTEKPVKAEATEEAPAKKKTVKKSDDTDVKGLADTKEVKKTKAAPKKAAAKKTSKEGADDLTKIEGIGPKISEHLHTAGITTFAELAKTKTEKIQEVLDNAGPKYNIHDPKTWAEQSGMAADGKWDELKVWQDELMGGK